MNRKLLILVWIMILAAGLWKTAFSAAPTILTIDGSTSYERARIDRLEHSLNFIRVAMSDTWNIHIIPADQFKENTERMKLPTVSAYTFVALDQTYINEGYLENADDQRVRQTLAHEAGHMICECSSESKANAIAWAIQ